MLRRGWLIDLRHGRPGLRLVGLLRVEGLRLFGALRVLRMFNRIRWCRWRVEAGIRAGELWVLRLRLASRPLATVKARLARRVVKRRVLARCLANRRV